MKFPNDILQAHAIWMNPEDSKDEYADFFPNIKLTSGHRYRLRIVCDSNRAVYLDGELISFSQYADYPKTPVYEDIILEPRNEGILTITVHHSGIDSQTHCATDAYVAFCIYENDCIIYASSEKTRSRPSPEYIPHLCKIITSQMGEGFTLTGRNVTNELHESYIKDIEIDSLRERPIKPLVLGNEITAKIQHSGSFRFTEGNDAGTKMKNAELDVTENADGIYYLFDLGEECVGFPDISFEAENECDVLMGWGEHITDGMCRSVIHSRRFTSEIEAKQGTNRYFPVLRRIGARYIQLFFTSSNIKDLSLTFRPVLLPADEIKLDLKNDLRNRIRTTAIHTLRCCMHDHYEDCPWREQALYTLDSRNQMLAGYKVFKNGNADFVRANLDLISRGVRDDGILALCYPAGLDYPIPFYTLAYFLQMCEYIENTGDVTLSAEKYDILVSLLDTFFKHSDERGLVRHFADSEGYWNFYEWSDHLSGDRIHKNTKAEDLPFEAILNAALAMACRSMSEICAHLGKETESHYYSDKSRSITNVISRTFFDPAKKLFFDFSDRPELQPSVLTQAMCLLCGAADGHPKDNILDVISANGGSIGGSDVVPATLSMACFRYDALLRENKRKYAETIINEIDRDGKFMLDTAATTFWETLKGEKDFGGAGSLCHGWSAMAAYYYAVLL